MTFQNSTGALISDKDRELETLRNEVLAIDFHIIQSYLCCEEDLTCLPLQIEVLRGENAVAKTLQSAVKTLERDKAQLQSRVCSLEQRLVGTQTTEEEAPPSGEEMAIMSVHVVHLIAVVILFSDVFLQETQFWSS